MIDQTGNVRLADFGLLTIVSDPTNLLTSSSYVQGGTARWMGPELIDPQRFGLQSNRPTKASDCYAFGMVIYETISGKPPFHQHGDLTVFTKVLDGERPPRRIGFTDSQWDMLRMCWKPQPSERPNIHDVLLCLATVSTLSDPQSLRLNGESEMDDDDWDLSDDSSVTKGGRRNAMTTRLDSCTCCHWHAPSYLFIHILKIYSHRPSLERLPPTCKVLAYGAPQSQTGLLLYRSTADLYVHAPRQPHHSIAMDSLGDRTRLGRDLPSAG